MNSKFRASAIYEGPRASARLGGFGRLAPRAPRGLGQPVCVCVCVCVTARDGQGGWGQATAVTYTRFEKLQFLKTRIFMTRPHVDSETREGARRLASLQQHVTHEKTEAVQICNSRFIIMNLGSSFFVFAAWAGNRIRANEKCKTNTDYGYH